MLMMDNLVARRVCLRSRIRLRVRVSMGIGLLVLVVVFEGGEDGKGGLEEVGTWDDTLFHE